MQEETFNDIADLALRISGQDFKPSKSYLMEARLSAISRREGFATLDDLAHCLKARPNPRFEQEIAAALTGKVTQFFADRDQLERIVTHAIPERLKGSKAGRLRIWCAGVSTGQEAYSLALRLAESEDTALRNAKIEIVATDLSPSCLEIAERGQFDHFEVQKGLSIHRLMRHFQRQETGNWQISDALKSAVAFRRHNLLEDGSALGHFDIILCRNVLKTMVRPMQQKALTTLSRQLLPGGLIFAAQGESLTGLSDDIVPTMDVRGAWIRKAGMKKAAVA